MANIHGMGDYGGNNNRNDQNRVAQGANGMPEFMNGVMMMGQGNRDPRKETFFQMLKDTFCPNLTAKSFITIITLLDSLTFLISFIGSLYEVGGVSRDHFLGTNSILMD